MSGVSGRSELRAWRLSRRQAIGFGVLGCGFMSGGVWQLVAPNRDLPVQRTLIDEMAFDQSAATAPIPAVVDSLPVVEPMPTTSASAVTTGPPPTSQPALPMETTPQAKAPVPSITLPPVKVNRPAGPNEPIGVMVPSLRVSAPVEALDVDRDSHLNPPLEVARTGWYVRSAKLGGSGHCVLVGHVDSSRQGRGAFYGLRTLRKDDRIIVKALNRSAEYKLTGVSQAPKGRLASSLFRVDGPHALILITCGGRYNSSTGHYEDNIVVVARPV